VIDYLLALPIESQIALVVAAFLGAIVCVLALLVPADLK